MSLPLRRIRGGNGRFFSGWWATADGRFSVSRLRIAPSTATAWSLTAASLDDQALLQRHDLAGFIFATRREALSALDVALRLEAADSVRS